MQRPCHFADCKGHMCAATCIRTCAAAHQQAPNASPRSRGSIGFRIACVPPQPCPCLNHTIMVHSTPPHSQPRHRAAGAVSTCCSNTVPGCVHALCATVLLPKGTMSLAPVREPCTAPSPNIKRFMVLCWVPPRWRTVLALAGTTFPEAGRCASVSCGVWGAL